MTEPLKPPSIDLIAPAWLRLIVGIDPTKVATTLPSDVAVLRTGAFVQAMSGAGGSPNRDVPLRAPVVRVACWAAPPEGSRQVPWGRASDAAERILTATYDPALMGRTIDLSSRGYAPAHVLTVVALSEPARVEGDPSGFARYDIDLLVNWRMQ